MLPDPARPASRQDLVDHRPVDALLAKLHPDGALAAWAGPVARLDPRPGERVVIEHAEFGHALDRAIDQVRPIARGGQSAPHLGDGP